MHRHLNELKRACIVRFSDGNINRVNKSPSKAVPVSITKTLDHTTTILDLSYVSGTILLTYEQKMSGCAASQFSILLSICRLRSSCFGIQPSLALSSPSTHLKDFKENSVQRRETTPNSLQISPDPSNSRER
jgi:hypothetical protein